MNLGLNQFFVNFNKHLAVFRKQSTETVLALFSMISVVARFIVSCLEKSINQNTRPRLLHYIRFCAGCRQSQKIHTHTEDSGERDGSGVSTWMIYLCGGCRIMHFWLVWHETKASWFPPLLRRRRGEGPSRWGEGRRRHPSSTLGYVLQLSQNIYICTHIL